MIVYKVCIFCVDLETKMAVTAIYLIVFIIIYSVLWGNFLKSENCWVGFTTCGTYSWSFVTQIFHNGQPSHGGDRKIFEVMTSTLPKGTIGYNYL
jgi:hypothetical protein